MDQTNIPHQREQRQCVAYPREYIFSQRRNRPNRASPATGLSWRPDEDNDAVIMVNVADDTALQHRQWDMTVIVEKAELRPKD